MHRLNVVRYVLSRLRVGRANPVRGGLSSTSSHWGVNDIVRTIDTILGPLYIPHTPSIGGIVMRCLENGMGAALRACLTSMLPGGFGTPPCGYYGPCARSSLMAVRRKMLRTQARPGD
jgi:hypothetical protein